MANRNATDKEAAVTWHDNQLSASSDNGNETELGLSSTHSQYLIERHGTTKLIPLPSQDPADPLNWPSWKKHVNLALVAFHGLMSTGGAVAAVPAFEPWSKLWGISINTASYIGSSQMLTLALGPLIWLPLANRFGRRNIWIASTLGAGLFNIGCALAKTYGTLLTLRILQAFFISPGIAMGQAMVAETFFAHERAQKMGVWTLMITLGPPMGPFIMGFVIYHLTWRWIFWIMAIINFCQMIGYILFASETLYYRPKPGSDHAAAGSGGSPFTPLTLQNFLKPFRMLADYRVLLATIAYAITFNFTLVLAPVEIPAIYTPLFHLNPQQIGLNFISLFIGCTLGEIVGGPISDRWQNWRSKRAASGRARPEERLWLSHIGAVICIVGLVVFLVTISNAKKLHYTVVPTVGVGIAGFGVQIITTVIITYCSDCHQADKSPALGAGINFIRCGWGFIGPFWFPYMFESLGYRGSLGLMAGIIVLFTIIPVSYLQKFAK